MSEATSKNDSLFSMLVDTMEESVIDITQGLASAVSDTVRDVADAFPGSTPEQLADAQHFANSVGDPEKCPPKDAAMAEMVDERRWAEEAEANLRSANGGSAELSEEAQEMQRQDRMEAYMQAQKSYSM